MSRNILDNSSQSFANFSYALPPSNGNRGITNNNAANASMNLTAASTAPAPTASATVRIVNNTVTANTNPSRASLHRHSTSKNSNSTNIPGNGNALFHEELTRVNHSLSDLRKKYDLLHKNYIELRASNERLTSSLESQRMVFIELLQTLTNSSARVSRQLSAASHTVHHQPSHPNNEQANINSGSMNSGSTGFDQYQMSTLIPSSMIPSGYSSATAADPLHMNNGQLMNFVAAYNPRQQPDQQDHIQQQQQNVHVQPGHLQHHHQQEQQPQSQQLGFQAAAAALTLSRNSLGTHQQAGTGPDATTVMEHLQHNNDDIGSEINTNTNANNHNDDPTRISTSGLDEDNITNSKNGQRVSADQSASRPSTPSVAAHNSVRRRARHRMTSSTDQESSNGYNTSHNTPINSNNNSNEHSIGMVSNPSSPDSPSLETQEPPAKRHRLDPIYVPRKLSDQVSDIVDEYVNGVQGGPSIRDLERTRGAKWRGGAHHPVSKKFGRMKPIYDAVEKGMAMNWTLQAIVEVLEKAREYGKDGITAKRSITWLQEHIPKELDKARE
ncbi:Hot1 protein [Saccharomycopsis crataegensis]|uniref:Hot1 protein n=1 Tax=Saccharomycopsis crataegensis TaxID=43959 RepID=A0AAV5QPP3_9ASCO|nr:Hot1 protein [Saccharomycopsis crataegensis]